MTDNNYAEKGAYGTVIADRFATGVRAAMNLTIPDTFSCLPLGFPNSDLHLMQKQFACLPERYYRRLGQHDQQDHV
jgi:hypothetical protein